MKQANEPNPLAPRGWPASRWGPWLAGAILVLLVAIVYWPTLEDGFVSDDQYHIKNNVSLRSLEGLFNVWFKLGTVEQYYPLAHTTYWIEYHLFGLNPRGYHVVNLLLHAIAAVLVWRLLLRLAVPGAWLAAAIFAVHPVEVESVAWISEVKNVLSCVLALGSLLAYLRFSPPEASAGGKLNAPPTPDNWRCYAVSLGLYMAALFAKTVAASVPAVLLVVYWWKRGRVTWRDGARLAPFFAVGLVLSGITVWMEHLVGAHGEEYDLSAAERVLIAGRALWFYAGKLAWPHPLIFYYSRWVIDTHVWWQYVFPAAAVSLIVWLWLARTRTGRGPLAGVLIFAGVMVPAIGFVSILTFRYSFVSDHYQYHASIALIALAAAAAVTVVGRLPQAARRLAPVAGAALLLPLAVVAQQRTHIYKDQMALDADIAAQVPESWAAHHNIGVEFRTQGKDDEAISHFRKVIDIFGKLARDNPTISRYRNDLAAHFVDIGFLQRKLGRRAESEGSFRRALEIRANLVRDYPTRNDYLEGLAWCYVNLAIAEQMAGRLAEAEDLHRKAIEIREKLAQDEPAVSRYPADLATSYVDFGLVQRDMGRPADSESWFQRALEIRTKLVRDDPTVNDYQDGLAWSYVQLAVAQHTAGRPTEAEAAHRKAIEIRAKLARDNPAVSKYQDAVAASYVDVGLLQRELGRLPAAESSFRKALEIRAKLVRDDPTVSDYQDGLAWCHVDLALVQSETGRPAEAEVSCRKAIEIREQLVRDHPANAAFRSNLASDLALCGNALALLGKWSQSADRYAQAVAAGNDSWQTMGRLALVQSAAGNEAGYRATCADLVRRHADNAAADVAFSIVLTLVVGERALDDMNQVLALAKRAADADPSNPIAAILVGVAQYRTGDGKQAIATLTGALSQFDPAAPLAAAKPDQALVGRLLGGTILALAYREHSDGEALPKQLESLRRLIDNTATPAPQYQGVLPPWAVGVAVEIAKRELAKLSVPADVPSG